jgi:hypothetical protein
MGFMGKILFAVFILGAMLVITSRYPSASEAPAVIELDHIGDIYDEVIFDHTLHVDIAPCATCHHHTVGTLVTEPRCIPCHKESVQVDVIACKGCHSNNPASPKGLHSAQSGKLFHIDTAGLKRAYHVQCMGCHSEMDVANECKDCHAKKG